MLRGSGGFMGSQILRVRSVVKFSTAFVRAKERKNASKPEFCEDACPPRAHAHTDTHLHLILTKLC